MAKKSLINKESRRRYPEARAQPVSQVRPQPGLYAPLQLCRICFREMALQGPDPGVVKSELVVE